MKSTFKKFFLKDDKFYLINNSSIEEISLSYFNELTEDFLLIIDDSYFYYLSPEIPFKNKRKLNLIIKNYLSTLFPEEFIKNFNSFIIDEKVLVYILNPQLFQIISDYKEIFDRAEFFTTPLLMISEKETNFLLKDKNKIIKFNNGEIKYLDNAEEEKEILTWNDIIFSNDLNYIYKIEIPGLKKSFNIFENLKPFLFVALICYILFFAGMFFKMSAKKKDYQFLSNKIKKIYKKYGVANTLDPYGMLLYKASKNRKIKKTNILLLLEKLSIATPENTFINNFYLKRDNFKIDGITDGFEKIDEFKTNLEKLFNKQVIITNTIKEKKWIKFRFVCR